MNENPRIDAPTTEGARVLVARVLENQPEMLVEFVKFCVTELVANAYIHGCGYTREELSSIDGEKLPREVTLTVALRQAETSQRWYIVMKVHDPNPERPDWKRDLAHNTGTTGRGLAVVRTLASGYGAISCGTGKDVFAEFEIDPPPAS